MAAMRARMRKEIEMIESDPPYGVSAWPKDNRLDKLEARSFIDASVTLLATLL
jgi:tRNA G10  N-methylase Trm11